MKNIHILAAVITFFRSRQENAANLNNAQEVNAISLSAGNSGNYSYTASANDAGPQNSGNSSNNASGSAGAGGAGHTGGDDTDGEGNRNDFAEQIKSGDTDYQDTGSITNDPGSGTGGTDYVGKSTGKAVDESVVDTVSGGGTTTGMIEKSGGATTTGVTTDETNIRGTDKGNKSSVTGARNTADAIMRQNSGEAKKASDPDYIMVDPAKRISADDQKLTDSDEPNIKSTERGTGSGAAMNNINEEDVDTGTGSASRGNRAGVPDADTGKIVGGTATSTGIDDSGLGPER